MLVGIRGEISYIKYLECITGNNEVFQGMHTNHTLSLSLFLFVSQYPYVLVEPMMDPGFYTNSTIFISHQF